MLKIKKINTNYLICCWSGARRAKDPRYIKDSTFFLKQQFKSLETLQNSLSQITLAVPDNPDEPKVFTEYIKNLPEKINKTKIVVLRRPNVGMSFGSLSDVYDKYKEEFDYYFFLEDDYEFALDNFDSVMVNFMESRPDCGYLCGKVNEGVQRPHIWALQAIGCFRSKALSQLQKINGDTLWPFPNKTVAKDYVSIENYGQIGLSDGILAAGYNVLDLGPKYKVGCRIKERTVIWYHKNGKEILNRPI